jgi:hypothetical protein
MNKDENIFEKSVKALKNEQIPPGPSDELNKATIEILNRISEQPNIIELDNRDRFIDKIIVLKSLAKFAVAAVFLIIAGFAAGRLTTTKPPDIEQIRASLEPAIRSRIINDMKQYMQLGLASSYVRLKDDLTEQYRQDLINIVAANSNLTNQLLENLVKSVDAAQAQQQQLFAATIEQIELNRRRDKAQLSDALITFATRTENELNQTKQDMAELLDYTRSEGFAPNELNNPNNIN